MGRHSGRHAGGRREAARRAGRGALRGAVAGLVVLGAVMVAVGAGLLGPGDDDTVDDGSSRTADVRITDGPERSALRRAAPPTGLTIPALSLKARVLPIEVSTDGVLDPPGDVSAVGWWERSAPVAARRGQTVLTGHSVHDGGGVMDDLEQLTRGDRVKTFHDGAMARYRVTSVRTWSKAELAERNEQIFAQDRGRGRLVLITCEDWNGSDWESNVVVMAKPVRRG